MITSKAELRRISMGVVNTIKNDMRSKIVSFMEQMGTDEAELANALDITVEDLNRILSGNGDISLSTFAKILVGSEHTLEIKPLPMRQERPMRRQAPFTTMTRMPRGMHGEKPSYEEFMRMVEEGKIPPPPAHMGEMGQRFGGMPGVRAEAPKRQIKHAQDFPTPNVNMDLESMTRRELVATIQNNGLANDIDLVNASRHELIDFLISNNFCTENENVAPRENVIPQMTREKRQSDKMARMMEMMADVLSKNPQLQSELEKYL